MAKIIGPLHSIEAHGRVDSLVFCKTGSTQYARIHSIGTRSASSKQLQQRRLMSDGSLHFHSLTEPQRKAWRDSFYYAPRRLFNDGPRPCKGYQYHNRVYAFLTVLGISALAWPFEGPPPLNIDPITLTRAGLWIIIDWTSPPQPHPELTHCQIWKFGPVRIGSKPDYSHMSVLAYVPLLDRPYYYPLTQPGRYYFWVRLIDGKSGWTTGFQEARIDIPTL